MLVPQAFKPKRQVRLLGDMHRGPTWAKSHSIHRGCQSARAHLHPCFICKSSTNFYDPFDTCPIAIISRIMHFPYINYLICSKRTPVTDLDFKTGSLWSWVSDHRVSFYNAQADVIFPLQCPLHLPIHKSSEHRNLSSKKKSHTHLH